MNYEQIPYIYPKLEVIQPFIRFLSGFDTLVSTLGNHKFNIYKSDELLKDDVKKLLTLVFVDYGELNDDMRAQFFKLQDFYAQSLSLSLSAKLHYSLKALNVVVNVAVKKLSQCETTNDKEYIKLDRLIEHHYDDAMMLVNTVSDILCTTLPDITNYNQPIMYEGGF